MKKRFLFILVIGLSLVPPVLASDSELRVSQVPARSVLCGNHIGPKANLDTDKLNEGNADSKPDSRTTGSHTASAAN